MQCENRCNNSIVYAEVESNVRSPKSLPHETVQWDTNQEHLAENNPTNLSLQTSPDDTVETSREHSATLTSLDIVVKRNSINGSVSSDMEDELDDASELYCDTTSQECLPQQLGYAPAVGRNTGEQCKQSEKQISVDKRISTVSYVSSGYGSLKDNNMLLTTEMVDIPIVQHVDSGTGLASSLAKDDNEVKHL